MKKWSIAFVALALSTALTVGGSTASGLPPQAQQGLQKAGPKVPQQGQAGLQRAGQGGQNGQQGLQKAGGFVPQQGQFGLQKAGQGLQKAGGPKGGR